MKKPVVQGTGLGLRRSFIEAAVDHNLAAIDFMELAPENWIDVGGKFGRLFAVLAEKIPFVCHGLSLNLGGAAPLDEALLGKIRLFLDRHCIQCYSEHLSYCADDSHLYDLLPIPFTEEAVKHVAARIRQASDILGRKIAIENISYYAAPDQQLSEIDFINAVLAEAECDLLLDINNIYVNSINHGYDAHAFLTALPKARIAYAHIAGHYKEAQDLLVDTHGATVIEPVWALLRAAYRHFGVFPTLLERDFNIPSLDALLKETHMITALQHEHQTASYKKTG